MDEMNMINERLKKIEKMIEKLLKIENIDTSDYSPSSESEDSLEFKEFLDEDIWEINKNENKECNECGYIDVEKDPECEGEQFVFWCDQCNCHVDASVNKKDVDASVNEDLEFCEGCRNGYLSQLDHMDQGGCLYELKRNFEEIESEDDIKVDFKRMRS